MKITLKDIAKETGVGVSTVSRILSGDRSRKIHPETLSLVLETATRLGYYEKKVKSLKASRHALNIACILTTENETFLDPFFSQVLDGVREGFEDFNQYRNLNISYLHLSQIPASSFYDAIIMLGRMKKDTLSFLQSKCTNIIYAGLNSVGLIDEVLCDSKEGMKDALLHLYNKGCRKISFIGSVESAEGLRNEHRYLGYLEGLSYCGLTLDKSLLFDINLSCEEGYKACKELINKNVPCDGVVCANDNVALGVIKALNESNINIGKDILVTGFDNIELSKYSTPSLTTFDVPKKELGRIALKSVVDRLDNPRSRNIKISIPYEIVVRSSTNGEKNE